MDNLKLLVAGSFELDSERRECLEKLGYEIVVSPREDVLSEFDPAEVDAVVCNWLFANHSIEAYSRLRCIQLLSAGLDRVPLEYIKEKGIRLFNARGVYSVPMAEFAVCGVLQLYKKSRFFYDCQRTKKWVKNREIRELSGSRVCIIGAGSVGQETAKCFSAFTSDIFGVDLYPCSQPYFRDVLPLDRLDEMLEQSDIVVLTLPLTDETRGMFSRERFTHMKEASVLVNIARGGIIDEDALADALEERLYGAVMDVFGDEPLNEHSRLWDMENVIVTPHNSFVSDRNSQRMWEVVYGNLKEFANERKSI